MTSGKDREFQIDRPDKQFGNGTNNDADHNLELAPFAQPDGQADQQFYWHPGWRVIPEGDDLAP